MGNATLKPATDLSWIHAFREYKAAPSNHAVEAAKKFLDVAKGIDPSTFKRDDLDACFWAASCCKKDAKPLTTSGANGPSVESGATGQTVVAVEFVVYSRLLIRFARWIGKLKSPENNKLSSKQIPSYAWALYAVATQSTDEQERRQMGAAYLQAMSKWMTMPNYQPGDFDNNALARVKELMDPNADKLKAADDASRVGDIHKAVDLFHEAFVKSQTLSLWMAVNYCWQMGKLVWAKDLPIKGVEIHFVLNDFLELVSSSILPNDDKSKVPQQSLFRGLTVYFHRSEKGEGGNRAQIPEDIARNYADLFEKRGCLLFAPEDFVGKPVPVAQQKVCRLKEYPSLVATALGFLARCFKEYPSLQPGPETMRFTLNHLECGTWVQYYYGTWLLKLGQNSDAVKFFAKTVRTKRNDAWAWRSLAEAYEGEPEKCRACLCRALTCPRQSPDIDNGVAKKVHALLGPILQRLGLLNEAQTEFELAKSQYLLPGNEKFYAHYAKDARQLLYADLPILTGVIIEQSIKMEAAWVLYGSQGETLPMFYSSFPNVRGLPLGQQISFRAEQGKDQKGRIIMQALTVEATDDEGSLPYLHEYRGPIRRRKDLAFGFVGEGVNTVFVPPALAVQFLDGTAVFGKAVRVLNRRKNVMGWQALTICTDKATQEATR